MHDGTEFLTKVTLDCTPLTLWSTNSCEISIYWITKYDTWCRKWFARTGLKTMTSWQHGTSFICVSLTAQSGNGGLACQSASTRKLYWNLIGLLRCIICLVIKAENDWCDIGRPSSCNASQFPSVIVFCFNFVCCHFSFSFWHRMLD